MWRSTPATDPSCVASSAESNRLPAQQHLPRAFRATQKWLFGEYRLPLARQCGFSPKGNPAPIWRPKQDGISLQRQLLAYCRPKRATRRDRNRRQADIRATEQGVCFCISQPTQTLRQINRQQDINTLKPPQSAFSGCFQLSFDYLVSTYEYRDRHIYAQRSRSPKVYYHF